MQSIAIILLISISAIALLNKLLFTAPHRIGAAMAFSNILFEALNKKWGLRRGGLELCLCGILTLGWSVGIGPWVGLAFASVYFFIWYLACRNQIELLENNPGIQEASYDSEQVPLPNPKMILYIKGPVLERKTCYDLGDWPIGHSAGFEAIVLNPTTIYPQFPVEILLDHENQYLSLENRFAPHQKAPKPGEFIKAPFSLKAVKPTNEPQKITLKIKLGSYKIEEHIIIRTVFALENDSVQELKIDRWKGGALAGFAWRGDMDLYDPGTFQSEDGLRPVLELSRYYRVPSSMYLSGRLSLVKDEHYRFCEKLGVDRNTDGIDDFIRFMRDEVELKANIEFPFDLSKKYAMELGNHMYLHYGTHSAMDSGNNWNMMAKMGDGKYFWQGEETDSFAEQRDNAIYNSKLINEKLDYQVKSWAAPSRAYDAYTPRAIEAAGMAVGSNTNATTTDDVLMLRPPHHPKGCDSLVEINKKYPGDPDDAYKVAMLKYWMGRAVRTKRAFVFMVHHHALQFRGSACMAMTEEILRHAIDYHRGAFHITTVYGLGEYWDRVLCPQHKWVTAKVLNDVGIEVSNDGNEALDDIPVEVTFKDNKGMLLLVSIPPGKSKVIDFSTPQITEQSTISADHPN